MKALLFGLEGLVAAVLFLGFFSAFALLFVNSMRATAQRAETGEGSLSSNLYLQEAVEGVYQGAAAPTGAANGSLPAGFSLVPVLGSPRPNSSADYRLVVVGGKSYYLVFG